MERPDASEHTDLGCSHRGIQFPMAPSGIGKGSLPIQESQLDSKECLTLC